MPSRGLEHADRADDVHLRVLDGPLDRDTHVSLGREVEDRLRPRLVEDVVEWLADVTDVELGLRRDVLARSADERVDDGDLVPARDERVDDVRADEARASGHHCPHGRILRTRARGPPA